MSASSGDSHDLESTGSFFVINQIFYVVWDALDVNRFKIRTEIRHSKIKMLCNLRCLRTRLRLRCKKLSMAQQLAPRFKTACVT